MKLCKIYSNDDNRFHNIKFHSGLNVVLAEINDKLKDDKDTHNLGKTLLISLIDFLLLKKIQDKSKFFLTKGGFEEQVFFAELKLNNGQYLIIRRGVDQPTKISFKLSDEEATGFPLDLAFDYENLSFKKAKEQLDSYLGFDVLPNWDYRKSITYFLRSQHDYSNVFELGKFKGGKHKDWKPFVFDLLGFNGSIVKEKYELEEEISELEKKIEIIQQESNVDINERDKIAGLLAIKLDERNEIAQKIDRFNFYESDAEINADLVDNIDTKIQILNAQRYALSVEIKKIENSLSSNPKNVDLDKLKRLYSDADIYFPDSLVNDFEKLLDFKHSITKERNNFLHENLTEYQSDYEALGSELKNFESEKERLLEYLTERDSYSKFKEIQKQLSGIEANLIQLEEKLHSIDKTSALVEKVEEKQVDVENKVKEINVSIDEQKHAEIRKTFNHIIKSILNVNALLSLSLNKYGNIEFDARIQNPESLDITSEDDGASYRKLLCIAFDIAILIYYSDKSFYHFAYHDGSLEALDDRKKIKYVSIINKICADYDLQYILTAIDSDLPRNEYGDVIPFSESEICLKLHDRDDSGKLFKRSF
ncbi:DUF2326 domain-containing protein [uncultured Methanolobus sp.]|uniref:DUF2326 domain-containing protein n=1 Tax=uncultured Methanolobus sp. TaxID=218300 RepID=UPI002AAB8200|nr:DUF2326 domain-containing protein [uncultured Methanolobus sp.]